MIAGFASFLTDTLVWTGVLIAAVLVLRRPVARLFGPGMSYAQWLLPLLRFALPPIPLPAAFAPAPVASVPAAAATAPRFSRNSTTRSPTWRRMAVD